jgi:hypothetical protein
MHKINGLEVLVLILLSPLFLDVPLAAAEGIRDVKPPVALPSDFFLLVLILLILIGIGAIWLIRFLLRKKRKKKAAPAPALPPWAIAYERLESLRLEDLPGKGRTKEYYTRLSDIVRRYIEDRFDIHAPEMTTEEFLFSLRNSSKMNPKQKEALQGFLNCCDMVKFARYSSNHQEMEQSFSLARRLVDETKIEVS